MAVIARHPIDPKEQCYEVLCLVSAFIRMEGWTLRVNTMNKLEAFEMWVYRLILKIPWRARKTSEEILRMIKRDANC